ncbi:uncharacterized protein TNCV_3965291 [Trichonephila clavipes]|nr:uncharacterized protein TNCV_3965291 [Trichonephila clavipes]
MIPIVDLTRLGYMQKRVEGYLIRGITQCFRSNNFYHTTVNCHIKARCLKCGEEHLTKDCKIKENPYCINCHVYGHTACYTKCPKFPHPKKETPIFYNKAKKNFESKTVSGGTSFADALSGNVPKKLLISLHLKLRKDKANPRSSLIRKAMPPIFKI